MDENKNKIETLLYDWGYSNTEDALEALATDSVSPGICMNETCNYSIEVEPDCRDGYCEECRTRSVTSLLVLLGVI